MVGSHFANCDADGGCVRYSSNCDGGGKYFESVNVGSLNAGTSKFGSSIFGGVMCSGDIDGGDIFHGCIDGGDMSRWSWLKRGSLRGMVTAAMLVTF
jgi:hypothetical protein